MANTNAGVAAFAARYLGPQPNDPEAGAPRRISSNSGATLSRQVPGSFSNIVRHGEDLTGTLIQVQGQSPIFRYKRKASARSIRRTCYLSGPDSRMSLFPHRARDRWPFTCIAFPLYERCARLLPARWTKRIPHPIGRKY